MTHLLRRRGNVLTAGILMSEMESVTAERAAELRGFPPKELWTPEESLALYEVEPDGTEVMAGVPVPSFVQTQDDRVRWANCMRVACLMFPADPPGSMLVLGQARVMFDDREKFV